MSATESTEQIRQKYPQGKITDRIKKHGRHKISKGPDGVVYPIATRVNRDATARANLSRKYQRVQRYQLLLDILAGSGNQYQVELINGGISFTKAN
ncbi:hypothetical protein ACJMK2_035143 [Sinanodonta woodiana]|uniref:Uncharacterized protein n=1 Tax=Sinanodonta woodiana TaxID=1069815 RepID=A0ABD3WUG7_SINWO